MNDLKKNSFVIGNCGDLKREEDQASLLKALRKLISKEINAEIIFLGDGPLRLDLENLAKQFNVADHVHFWHDKITFEEFLNHCHAIVFSGFAPNPDLKPVHKAMTAGKPVIVTKIEGYRDIVEDGKSGFLVPCGFPERIEAAIKKLEANPDLYSIRSQIEHY